MAVSIERRSPAVHGVQAASHAADGARGEVAAHRWTHITWDLDCNGPTTYELVKDIKCLKYFMKSTVDASWPTDNSKVAAQIRFRIVS